MALQSDDLAMFLVVAREGSFGRAASALLVSQPAVSERMARLEREVGATLFTRGARGTTLTAAGEHLVPYANRMSELMDEAVGSVRELESAPLLRVAVHVTFAHRVVPLVLSVLREHERCVKLRDAHSDEIIAMLLDGVIDVGFVVPGARPRPLRFMALPDDHVIGLTASAHPLAGRRLTLPQLAESGCRLAFNRWGPGSEDFVGRLRAAGMPEGRWIECSDAVTALALGRSHDHLAIVPASVAAQDLANGSVIRLDLRPAPRWSMPLVLAHRSADQHDPAIASIRAAVRQLPNGRP
jgi:DNA-binding transcriptional LysR family regulator